MNLEGGATINSVVAIFFVRNFHSSGACIGVVFVRNCVLTIRNSSIIVFDHNGRCFSGFVIDSARANLDSRVCYGFRQDFPLYRFCAGVVAITADSQRIAARVGLLRDLHGVVVISTQRFITELDRDRRLLWVAVVGQVTDCDRRAHKADWRNGDGDLGALGIVVAGEGDAVGVRPGRKIGG